MDEFRWIDRLRPLTRGDPRALNLNDDAAILPSRIGFDLVISTDAMVEGVHFLSGEAMDTVARRLLRTSLSDLAAKAAEPFGYFLTIAWPARFDDADRDRFIAGLDEDGRRFGLVSARRRHRVHARAAYGERDGAGLGSTRADGRARARAGRGPLRRVRGDRGRLARPARGA